MSSGSASLSRNPEAPALIASSTASSVSKVVSTSTRVGREVSSTIRSVAAMPSMTGIRMSISATSGVRARTRSSPARPSSASPTTSMSSSASSSMTSPARISFWSSITTSRMGSVTGYLLGRGPTLAAAPMRWSGECWHGPGSGPPRTPVVKGPAVQGQPLPHPRLPRPRPRHHWHRLPPRLARGRASGWPPARRARRGRSRIAKVVGSARPPCFRALVSDSCTTRYSANSAAGTQAVGRARGAQREPEDPAQTGRDTRSSISGRPGLGAPSRAAGPPSAAPAASPASRSTPLARSRRSPPAPPWPARAADRRPAAPQRPAPPPQPTSATPHRGCPGRSAPAPGPPPAPREGPAPARRPQRAAAAPPGTAARYAPPAPTRSPPPG